MAWIVSRKQRDGRPVAHVQWRDRAGKVRSRSLGTADPHIVELERQLTEQREEGGAVASTIIDDAAKALESFAVHVRLSCSEETADFYLEKLGRIFAFFAGTPMRTWSRADFERFIASRVAEISAPVDPAPGAEISTPPPAKRGKGGRLRPWSARMIAMHVAAAKRFIAWAREMDVVCPDFVGRFKGPRIDRPDAPVLSREQLDALLEAAKGSPLEPAVALAGLAGLRRKEFSRLEVGAVRWVEGKILVTGFKTHRDRWVDMSPSLVEILKRHRPTSGPIVRYDPKAYGAYADFHALCDKAGIPRCGWHTLRHTYATLLLRGGARITEVRDLLGHGNISTTSRYVHTSDADRAEAVRRAFG